MEWTMFTRALMLVLLLKMYRIHGIVRPAECLLKDSDDTYAGTVSVTNTGKVCQRWDKQEPHMHDITADVLPDKTLADAANYCRVTAEGGLFPSCYPTDPDETIEPCRVPYCTAGMECKVTESGSEYMGTKSTLTQDGKTYTCQRWDSQTPSDHTHTEPNLVQFHEKTLKEVQNYCRNFKDEEVEGPWCYTTDPDNLRIGYCRSIPLCPQTNLCSSQPTIENGKSIEPPIKSKYDLNFKITYKCDAGFEFEDKYDGITCMLSGSWSTPPKCVRKKCPTLSVPNSKMVSTHPDPRVGDKVTFTCNTGYVLKSGDATRTCRTDSTWSGILPVCDVHSCGFAPEVTDATLTSLTTVRVGGKATYKCSKDGKTFTKECKDDSKWHGDSGACTTVVVTTSPIPPTTTQQVLQEAGSALESKAFIAGLSIGLIAVAITAVGIGVWLGRIKRTKFKEKKVAVRPESRGSSGYDSDAASSRKKLAK